MAELRLITGGKRRTSDRATRLVFIWSLGIGILLSGIAFAYKVAEFIYTMSAPEARGFADVPVTVYFFVAGGWLMLLVWCVGAGKFKEMDQARIDMLEQEEEYERQGI